MTAIYYVPWVIVVVICSVHRFFFFYLHKGIYPRPGRAIPFLGQHFGGVLPYPAWSESGTAFYRLPYHNSDLESPGDTSGLNPEQNETI